MKNVKLIKWIASLVGAAAVIGIGVAAYLWFMPHRDVQAQKPDLEIGSTELVKRYLQDPTAANAFFLREDGDSKILAISGTIGNIMKNQAGAVVVRLAEPAAKAGVLCTLTDSASASAGNLQVGQTITLKGVIRAGAEFDDLMGIYIDAVMDECAPL